MSGGYEYLMRITLADAESEAPADRLDFTRRRPSLATAQALQRASAPPMDAADMAQLKAKRRPRAA